MRFSYDGADRLKESTGSYGYGNTESGITYDKNGNIKTLNRSGFAVDNLSYSYPNGNRLESVSNSGGNGNGVKNGGSTYSFDGNGNVIFDGSRGAAIAYNYLNLPQTVTVGASPAYSYYYDASGTKHKYVAGTFTAKYAGVFEYDQNNALRRVRTSTGQAVPVADTLRFDYFLKDHLGNVRVVVDEFGRTLQQTDYYPFGLAINKDGRSQVMRNDTNRLLYNEKEYQVGSGYLDYGARMYMSEIGRWGVVDPKAELFPSLTVNNFAENNPIKNIDPDGMASQTIYDFDGNAHTVGDNDYAYSSDNGDCCPQKPMQADATSRANSVTPRIAAGGVVLLQREQGTLSNADSRLLPHEQATIEGLATGLQIAGSEAVIARLAVVIRAQWLASTVARTVHDGKFYSVVFETKIASNLYPGKGAYSHFKAANTALANAMSSDAAFANSIKQIGINVPKTEAGTITGGKIQNWVWHHSAETGTMQLVPQIQHTNGSIFWNTLHPGGRGGMSIWGGGYK